MEKSILLLLKNKYNQLSETEKKIADYIFDHTGKIPDMTIASFAQEAGVAASGVVRLCKSLGFSGFTQLKRNLLELSYASPACTVSAVLPEVALTDDVTQVFHKVFASSIHTLQDTYRMLDMPQIEKAAEQLSCARNIHFFGVGTSATIAHDAYYRFMRIGLSAHSEVDSQIMPIAASHLTDQDVAVAISHCGETADTVETLQIAKESGAFTIAITSKKDSSVCRYADITIVVYSDEIQYSIEAVSARIAHIAVLDALCVVLSLKNPVQTTAYMNQMNQLLYKKRF